MANDKRLESQEADEHGEWEPRGSIEDQSEKVRFKYYHARRNQQRFEAMIAARQVAEAVSKAVVSRIRSEDLKGRARVKQLDKRLGLLERLAEDDLVDVPKAVIAGLRTLQAYGNYAAHDHAADTSPPMEATQSAMASLALVAQWFLEEAEPGADREFELKLVESPPDRPGFRERRRLHRLVQEATSDLPKLPEVQAYHRPGIQLTSLLAVHEQAKARCEAICRVVVGVETELDPAALDFDRLSLVIGRLSSARPERVPPSIARRVEEVWTRWRSVARAIQEEEQDAERYRVEAEQGDPVADIERWFSLAYLGRSKLEQNWLKWLVMAGLASLACVALRDCGQVEGRKKLRSQLLADYCADVSAAKTPICAKLRGDERKPAGAPERK
jgi:hypothetical protein